MSSKLGKRAKREQVGILRRDGIDVRQDWLQIARSFLSSGVKVTAESVAVLLQRAAEYDRGKRPTVGVGYVDSAPWGEWHVGDLAHEQRRIVAMGERGRGPDWIKVNNLYEVWGFVYPESPGNPAYVWLSIKRRNKDVIRDWRHLQRIKNELVGPECEGVEIFPAESRLVDASNQFHLFVYTDPAVRVPMGYGTRDVAEVGEQGAVQRPPGKDLAV